MKEEKSCKKSNSKREERKGGKKNLVLYSAYHTRQATCIKKISVFLIVQNYVIFL